MSQGSAHSPARSSLVELAMKQWRIVTTLIAVLVAYGVLAFLTMPRQEFPEFTIRQGLVVGVMPGASASEVEERLTKPTEAYLFGFKEVNKKKTHSISQEGRAVVFVELNENVKGLEAPAFWAKLRHGLNEFKTQRLPSQVVAIVGNNDFGDTSALLFTIVSEGHSPRELESQLDVLEAELRRIDATSKIGRVGLQREVIRVTIARERLARYGLRPLSVWSALQGLGDLPAAARLDTDAVEMPIHVGKALRTEQELGELIVLSEPTGPQVRLKDVATITREYGHDDAFVRYNGKTGLVLSVEMQRGHDITAFGADVTRAVERAKRKLPPTVQIARVADQPEVVQHSITHFLRDFGLAIVSVILVTLLLLPVRVATVAAVTIPICVAITLGLLNAFGIELQTVSLAGLVVVLGMVVDNAIVVIDDHLERVDAGLDPWTSAWKSAEELFVPVFTATLAIVMAYAPLAIFLTGTGGDFIGSLPATIAIALGTSLILAITLVPIMNARFIRKGLHRAEGGKRSLLDRVQTAYDATIALAFRAPVLTALLGVLSVVAALAMAAFTPQQLFPKVERNQFAVEIYLPPGRALEETNSISRTLESALLADSRVKGVTAFVGASSPRFHTVYAPNLPSRNYGQLLVNTVDDKAAVAVLQDFDARFRGAFPNAWVRWKQLDMQASTAPIEVRLSGDDIGALKAAAVRIEAAARAIPGATWVRNDFEQPLLGVEVMPDIDAASRLGVSRSTLQASLAVGTASGVPLTTIWEGDYPVNVLLADERKDATSLEGLRQQYVTSTLALAAVPVDQVAKFRPQWTEGTIARRNGVRTLTVGVDVGFGVLASDVQQRLTKEIKALGPLPDVELEYGGELEASRENYGPMGMSLAVSVAAIYVILLFQFQRHLRALLVMLTMPLSLFGSVLGLVVTGYPFGFTAFLGVISLMGIVVRNGIILVGYADELVAGGASVREAALAAGKRRMRPIFLTSMAAALGVVPMILSGSSLWGPLGAVTAFGLVLSMVLTLIVLPVAYWLVLRRSERPESPAQAQGTTPLASAAVATAVIALGIFFTPSVAHAQDGALTLARARTLAAENSAEVQRAQLEVTAAQAVKQQAYTKYFPKVSATAVDAQFVSPPISVKMPGGNLPVYNGDPATLPAASQFAYSPSVAIEGGRNIFSASLTAVQPLYAGGRISTGNRLADLGVEVSRTKVLLSQRDAVCKVEEKYWLLSSLAEKERTLTAYESLLAELEREASDALKAGLVTQNDLLKVRLARQRAAVDRKRLEDGRRLAAQDLRQFLGLPAGDQLPLSDPLERPVAPTSLTDERARGLEARLELRMLRAASQATALQSDLKRGEALPSLAVGATAFHYRVSELTNGTNAAVFVTLDVPLSAWWERSYQTDELRAREQIDSNRIAEVKRLLALDVQKAWDDLTTAYAGVEVADSAVAQSKINAVEVKSRQASGEAPFSDVLEAELLMHQAEEQQVDTWAEYWTKRASFQRAVSARSR